MSHYHCLFCGGDVTPTPEMVESLQKGELLGLAHLGEFVEMAERRPMTREEVALLWKK